MLRIMAFLGTMRTSYTAERAADRPKRTRRPLLVLAATALGRAGARLHISWAALRTLVLTLAAFALIDTAAFHFGRWVGLAVTGVSLLALEALTSSDGP
jgi:hypothetical protein